MPIIEAAFRRAQDSAKEQLGTPLDKEPGQTVTYWLVRHDDFKRAVAEGIRSYLDDPEVRGAVGGVLQESILTGDGDGLRYAPTVLQAIGAKP